MSGYSRQVRSDSLTVILTSLCCILTPWIRWLLHISCWGEEILFVYLSNSGEDEEGDYGALLVDLIRWLLLDASDSPSLIQMCVPDNLFSPTLHLGLHFQWARWLPRLLPHFHLVPLPLFSPGYCFKLCILGNFGPILQIEILYRSCLALCYMLYIHCRF